MHCGAGRRLAQAAALQFRAVLNATLLTRLTLLCLVVL